MPQAMRQVEGLIAASRRPSSPCCWWVEIAGIVREVLEMGPDDRMLSYLPLSHIAERAASLYVPMACGGSTWFAESLEKLGENLRECRPTLFFAVPRVSMGFVCSAPIRRAE